MAFYTFFTAAIMALLLTACGGGGSSSSDTKVTNSSITGSIVSSITGSIVSSSVVSSSIVRSSAASSIAANPAAAIFVEPRAITFNRSESEAPAEQTITVNFKGDGVVVGYAHDIVVPEWLTVETISTTATTATFKLSVNEINSISWLDETALSLQGDFLESSVTTTLRFTTAKADGTGISYVDVPVSYSESPVFEVRSFFNTTFTAISNDPTTLLPNKGFDFSILGDKTDWLISTDASWLKLSASSGHGSTVIRTTVDPTSAKMGLNNATITVLDKTTHTSKTISASITINAAKPLLGTNEISLDITTATKLSELTIPLTISDESQGKVPGNIYRWKLKSVDAPWLTLATKAGTTASSNVNNVIIDPALIKNLPNNNYYATIVLTMESDSQAAQDYSISVLISVNHVAVQFYENDIAISIDKTTPLSALTIPLPVAPMAHGEVINDHYNWTITAANAPWLKMSTGSGVISTGSKAEFTIDRDIFSNLPVGPYSETLTLSISSDFQPAIDISIPIHLYMQLPKINFVGSYIGIANTPGKLLIRGYGFSAINSPITVTLNDREFNNLVADNDTQITLNYPGLSAGDYAVSIKDALGENELGLNRADVKLTILDPVIRQNNSINVQGSRERLVFDAERETLYAVNRVEQRIERYHYSNGAWVSLDPLVVAGLKDINLSPDGKSLSVISNLDVYSISLTASNFVAQHKATLQDNTQCGEYFDQLTTTNTGEILIRLKYSLCESGNGYGGNLVSYDLKQSRINYYDDNYHYLFAGINAVGSDGSRIYIAGGQSTIFIYRSFDNLFGSGWTSVSTDVENASISVSADSSKVVIDRSVYDGNIVFLGYLPASGKALVSQDSQKAYLYRDDGSPRIEVYDLHGMLQPDGSYPKSTTIPVASALTVAGTYAKLKMIESPDGKTLFVSGDKKIVVVALP